MLTRTLEIKLNGMEVGTTPMLVPAVSSRANLELGKLIKTIREIVNGPFLMSAYDFYYYHKRMPIVDFPDLVFLDSGGYECSKDKDITDIGLYNPEPEGWDAKLHEETLVQWNSPIPTVIVSFDHPDMREDLSSQIYRANELFAKKTRIVKEILIKPETRKMKYINIKGIKACAASLSDFDVIGFTEKELGSSVLKRMINIAHVREILDDNCIEKPIHIFGSLDPVLTPLYYMAGADIFDGLSWLRFMYDNSNCLYVDSYGPKRFGIGEDTHEIWIKILTLNSIYLKRLKDIMIKFHVSKDFKLFGKNSKFYKHAVELLNEKVGGE
ncbi:MAG: hypothetical protein ACYDCP_03285 [Thermoplasmataceae archaeon]